MPEPCSSSVRDLHAWYGESHILHGVDFEVRPRRGGHAARPQRRRARRRTLKSVMGIVPRRTRLGPLRRAESSSRRPSNRIARLGLAFCPEERGIFASLNVEENLLLPPRGARRAGSALDAIFGLFPNLTRAAAEPGHQAVGRRAADAGHRPHPPHRAPGSCCWTSRPRAGAGDRPADRRHHPAPQGRGVHDPARRAELPASRRPWPTATTSWSAGAWWT